MKIKTIVLAFGLLFVFGLAMFAVEALSTEVVYDVVMPVELPDELSADEVSMLRMLGVLRAQVFEQLTTNQGSSCFLKVTYCGGNHYCTYCLKGRGVIGCACSVSVDASVK